MNRKIDKLKKERAAKGMKPKTMDDLKEKYAKYEAAKAESEKATFWS